MVSPTLAQRARPRQPRPGGCRWPPSSWLLTACGETHVSAEAGQFSRWGRGARLTRRVREEYRVYFDRNAERSEAEWFSRDGSPVEAAWVLPQAARCEAPHLQRTMR